MSYRLPLELVRRPTAISTLPEKSRNNASREGFVGIKIDDRASEANDVWYTFTQHRHRPRHEYPVVKAVFINGGYIDKRQRFRLRWTNVDVRPSFELTENIRTGSVGAGSRLKDGFASVCELTNYMT